jgi:hypothetical protein
MKDKVFTASDYTKFLRQNANTTLSVADGPGKGRERVSEVSKTPITDTLSIANILQFTRSFLRPPQVLLYPRDITGLALWLDAANTASVTSTGNSITGWLDQSGNGRNLTTVISNSGSITYSDASLVFNKTAYMFINTPVNLQSFTVFFIGKTLATSGNAGNQMIFCARPNSGGQSYNATDGLGLYYDYNTPPPSSNRFHSSSNVPGNVMVDTVTYVDLVLNCYTHNTGQSLSSYLYGSSGTTITSPTRTSTSQGFAVGAEFDKTVYKSSITNNFQINEIIVYTRELNYYERQQIEGYLAWKWGVVGNLPNDHMFKKR